MSPARADIDAIFLMSVAFEVVCDRVALNFKSVNVSRGAHAACTDIVIAPVVRVDHLLRDLDVASMGIVYQVPTACIRASPAALKIDTASSGNVNPRSVQLAASRIVASVPCASFPTLCKMCFDRISPEAGIE